VGGAGSDVSDGREVGDGGSVAVMIGSGVAVGKSVWIEILHPVARNVRSARMRNISFEVTE